MKICTDVSIIIDGKDKCCYQLVELRFHTLCYDFGCGMVWTTCLFMIYVSGLFDLFGTGSNIFDPCPFSYYLYLVFPFLSRQSSLVSPLVSSILVFPFYGCFQRLLVHTYVG
jgi:hypothetical protein